MTLATYPILSLRGVRPSFLRPQITGGAEWKKKKKKKKHTFRTGDSPRPPLLSCYVRERMVAAIYNNVPRKSCIKKRKSNVHATQVTTVAADYRQNVLLIVREGRGGCASSLVAPT